MLVKLIRPLLENGLNSTKLICISKLNTSNVLFQQSYSDASAKPTDKTSKSKNKNQAESDNEQEKSQQEGPADREAEQK